MVYGLSEVYMGVWFVYVIWGMSECVYVCVLCVVCLNVCVLCVVCLNVCVYVCVYYVWYV